MGIERVSSLPRTADVVIVGGGVVGAATAFFAARAGLRPLVLERRPELASLTTAAAAGGFRLQLDTEEELRLVSESVELFLNFEAATGQHRYSAGVRQQGYLWLTTTRETATTQRRRVTEQRSWGVGDVELLDGDEVRRRFPHVGSNVLQGRFRQGDGLLDPGGVALGLMEGSGTTVATGCGVTGLLLDGDRVTGVETSAGSVVAGATVVAAGPFSGEVASKAGIELPIACVRRQKVVLADVPLVPREAPMTIDEDTGAHWRPASDGAALMWSEPDTPPTPPSEEVPTDRRFAFALMDPASSVSVARITPFWRDVWEAGVPAWSMQAGQYVMTPDGRPLVGSTGIDGLWVNAGHGGRGVMSAPATGRILVDLMTGRMRADENPYAPDRTFGVPAPAKAL